MTAPWDAAEPVASPHATILLALRPIAGIDAHLLVTAVGMRASVRGERRAIEQAAIT
jgi:hypothetical protein